MSWTGEEEEERETLEVAGEEGRGLSEVAEEGSEFEGERREGDEVVGSWARVREGSILMESVAGSITLSDADGYVAELWIGDGDAISWARVDCDPSSERSRAGGEFPSDGVSLVHISIGALSERCGFFSACEMSSGDGPVWN